MARVAPPKIPRVPLDGRLTETPIRIPGVDYPTYLLEAETPVLAEESSEAALIAADAEISIPLLTGAIILLGLLYAAKYIIVPLAKLVKIPGTNFFSDFVNDVIGYITAPIKSFVRVLMTTIAQGIEAHAQPITRLMEAAAWTIHDTMIELANAFASTAVALNVMRAKVIPEEINKQTIPIRKRLTTLERQNKLLDAIARQYGYANFPTLMRVATPAVKELVAAEVYVKTQRHVSLAGALSTYEAAAKRVRVYEETVRKLKFYDVPAWIRQITTSTTRTIPETVKKLALRVGKIEKLTSFNTDGIPTLLALMTPAAIGRWWKPAIPSVCTEVGECAANNLLGSNIWRYFKDLLGLALALTIGAFALEDLCAISKLAVAVVGEIEPEIRGITVVAGGMSSIGCASPGQSLSAPLY